MLYRRLHMLSSYVFLISTHGRLAVLGQRCRFVAGDAKIAAICAGRWRRWSWRDEWALVGIRRQRHRWRDAQVGA